jgi:hypothetical protein
LIVSFSCEPKKFHLCYEVITTKTIWSTKKKFGIPKKKFGVQKKNLVDQISFGIPNLFLVYQKKVWYTKIFWSTKLFFGRPNLFLVYQNFFCRPKKLEIDRTIGIPERLTKSTWTPLMIIVLVITKEKLMGANFNQENWMLVIWLL